MQFINSFANLIFHIFPPGVMDFLANASLPNSGRAFKVFSKIKPKVFEYYSGKKMLFMFRKAARNVPAYKKFLQSQNVDPSEINSIEDFDKLVPRTTKENYIKAYSLSDRCVNGEFPQKGSFEESSGSSGTSTLWIRSLKEERYTMALMKASLLHLYGFREEDNFIVLNCFYWVDDRWSEVCIKDQLSGMCQKYWTGSRQGYQLY
jgi:phenylacetate-coenzyme A ligase PaaK-like adenylate-forming protein